MYPLAGNDSGLSSRIWHVPIFSLTLDPADSVVGVVEQHERVEAITGDYDLEGVHLKKVE